MIHIFFWSLLRLFSRPDISPALSSTASLFVVQRLFVDTGNVGLAVFVEVVSGERTGNFSRTLRSRVTKRRKKIQLLKEVLCLVGWCIYIFFLLRLLTPVHIFHIIQEIEGRGGLGRRLCASYAINRFETVFLRGGWCVSAGWRSSAVGNS